MIRLAIVVLALFAGAAYAGDTYEESKCVEPEGWHSLDRLVEAFKDKPGEPDVLYLRDLRVFMCTQMRLGRLSSTAANDILELEMQRVTDKWNTSAAASGDL